MNQILKGMRVIEGSAFVAAPLGGMTLAQMGADVIRFDPIGGGLDFKRWPVTRDGKSLFWAGLNKGKRSIAVDLRSARGRELLTALICAPEPEAGLFLTNFPLRGWLDYENLSAKRKDLVIVNIVGNHDGSSAVDYTVNPATGEYRRPGVREMVAAGGLVDLRGPAELAHPDDQGAVEQAARTKLGHQGGPTGVEDAAQLLDGVEILRVRVPPQGVRAVDGGERHLDEWDPPLDQPAGQQATLAERVPAVSVLHGGGFLVQVERLGGRRPHHLHGPNVGTLVAERRDPGAVREEVAP